VLISFVVLFLPVLFHDYMQDIYLIQISQQTLLTYTLLLTYVLFFVTVGYSLKIKIRNTYFPKKIRFLLVMAFVVFLFYWLMKNIDSLASYGIILALTGGDVGVSARLDATGNIDNWFTISLISGFILPIILRLSYNSKILQFFPLTISLIGGSKFLFFAHLLTVFDNFKIKWLNVFALMFVVVSGLSVFAVLKDISLISAPEKILRRLILLPGYICLIKIENANVLNNFATIARDTYQIGWGWSGNGGAPSFVLVDMFVVGQNIWVIQIAIFSTLIGLFHRSYCSLCYKMNARYFSSFPWLILVYSSGPIIMFKFFVLFITIYVFGSNKRRIANVR